VNIITFHGIFVNIIQASKTNFARINKCLFMKKAAKKNIRPAQSQRKPGVEARMKPLPVYDDPAKKGSGKLRDKVVLITGADSGIGRAVAVLFAKEGADIAVVYLKEHKDAEQTREEVEAYGRKCLLVSGDLASEKFCISCVRKTVKEFGRLDIIVNNAGMHTEQDSLENISTEQLEKTFATNVFASFWVSREALKHLKKGSAIINTSSVTAYRGSGHLIDYASTKAAIVGFTRSLASNLAEKGIRVNAVAPGPVWTPLIASAFKPSQVAKFGSDSPMGRAGEPVEIAPAYLFLACDDASYITGQVLHPNGGEIING
jgi:NAD(P)-dependent dehydrogenase (short-subunit alcohol dehydrogenase family)